MNDTPPPAPVAPPVPRSFLEYVRSFGPGIVIVLTWLGAGDVVDMGTAGANYGYSLMWVLVVALLLRFVFVSLIARYQLCNQHGEGVLDGLVRLHRWFAPFLLIVVFILGHYYLAYMTIGVGEVCRNVFGLGEVWHWAVASNVIAAVLVFRPSFRLLELVFMFFLAVLSVSFVGSALWVGFNPADLGRGLFRTEMPGQHGHFPPWEVALAMIGAVGGSLMNLVYPYFLEAKGWRGPRYRRVQFYDFLLGVFAMIILNLAVWILGAEVLFPDKHITTTDDLAQLLGAVLGRSGAILFYAGVFAAIYTSVIGHAAGLGCLGSHAWQRWRRGSAPTTQDLRRHPLYRVIVVWCLASPLVWVFWGQADFVGLTLAVNSAQVVLLPVLAGGVWWITASKRFIGEEHRNRWWENAIMGVLFSIAVYFAIRAGIGVVQKLGLG